LWKLSTELLLIYEFSIDLEELDVSELKNKTYSNLLNLHYYSYIDFSNNEY